MAQAQGLYCGTRSVRLLLLPTIIYLPSLLGLVFFLFFFKSYLLIPLSFLVLLSTFGHEAFGI